MVQRTVDDFVGKRGLIDPQRLKALSAKSDVKGGVQMATHLGAICATGILLWQLWGSYWAVPVFVLHGVLLNFLYAAQHELSHNTVFQTKWLNEWFGRLVGFIELYPRDFDQIQHFAHHRHTQDWEKDGELARGPFTLRSYLLWMSGIVYWQTRIARILRFTRGVVVEPYIREKEHATVIFEGRVHFLLYCAIAVASLVFESWAAVIFWLAPMMLTKCVHQLQNTSEHLGLSHNPNTLENTRTLRTNAFMRWMAWNMQYHTAHHTFPSVPFHLLPDLHQDIVEKWGREPYSMTYFGFQAQAIRRLMNGRTEADYPMDQVWIADGLPDELPADTQHA